MQRFRHNTPSQDLARCNITVGLDVVAEYPTVG